MRYMLDDNCPSRSEAERDISLKRRVIWALVLIGSAMGASIGFSWHAEAAIANPYYRVTLSQGQYDVGYGQGATADAAWNDCQRLAALPRTLTAAETRKSPVAAITKATVRTCKNPVWYVTVSPDPVVPPPPPGEALSWVHDGANTTGFRIVYGPAPAELVRVVQINSATQRSFRLTGLSPGTYYFAIKAFNASGESAISNLVTKTVQ